MVVAAVATLALAGCGSGGGHVELGAAPPGTGAGTAPADGGRGDAAHPADGSGRSAVPPTGGSDGLAVPADPIHPAGPGGSGSHPGAPASGPTQPTGPDAAITSPPLAAGQPVEPAHPAPARPTGRSRQPVPVAMAVLAADPAGTTVEVGFWNGVEPCSVLDRVEVDEQPDRVTITVVVGDAGTGADIACPALARWYSATVGLTAPLGDRPIVDGAAS